MFLGSYATQVGRVTILMVTRPTCLSKGWQLADRWITLIPSARRLN